MVRILQTVRRVFHQVSPPLREFTCRDVSFKWYDTCEQNCLELKQRLTSASILTLLVEGKEYDILTNASHQALRVVLM